MAGPLLWWHHHALPVPVRGADMRFSVQRHPWGVTVWEGPTRRAPWVPLRVVEVLLSEPTAPVGLAAEVAANRLPAPGWDRRLATALPGHLSPQVVRVGTCLLPVLLVVAWSSSAVPTIVAGLLWLLTVAVTARSAPDRRARRALADGHVATSIAYSGRIQMADALCTRALAAGHPHADALRHVVRVALWDCRVGNPVESGRLNRWLNDIDRADTLAGGITMYARSMSASVGGDTGQAGTVARAAALVPSLVAAMGTGDVDHRREALAQLGVLRDACRDARAAREALEAAVVVGPPHLRPVGRGHDPAVELERDQRRDRVGELLRELQSEAGILREVESEIRGRDLPHSHGA